MLNNRNMQPIEWNKEVVGFIENPRSDLWFRFGKWIPLDKQATQKFIALIKTSGEAEVVFEGKLGLVVQAPEDEINVMIWPEILEE